MSAYEDDRNVDMCTFSAHSENPARLARAARHPISDTLAQREFMAQKVLGRLKCLCSEAGGFQQALNRFSHRGVVVNHKNRSFPLSCFHHRLSVLAGSVN